MVTSKHHVALWLAALLLAVVALFPVAAATAQDGPEVRIDPQQVQVQPEVPFEVAIAIENAIDLGAFQFTLEFGGLSVVGVHLGPFLGSTGRQVQEGGLITETGSITFAAVSEPGAPGPSGEGILATVELVALEVGDEALVLRDVLLADTANTPILVLETYDAVVQVRDEPILGWKVLLPNLLRERVR